MNAIRREPYGYLIDDSAVFSPYFCRDAEMAEGKIEAGHKVVRLYADAADLEQPGPQERVISASAQRILRDLEGMAALRRIRLLSGAGERATLTQVAESLEAKLRMATWAEPITTK